ncbi:hypothetical protein ABB37_09399 [Leptomonas pyrrhocoris]|uniref:Uncharacterized protein n=1 Tax=Leptomonas pyrrhocoris TaxID=157538 RepID=A0A0M9FR17_LEPPY|nr:hypothetical protein ABB37_09399 [Leptomonas pyrrhocoris]XP_015652554.1 hypothetical protein ABB37_09399 [Leptomonas pyrrhocoris]XP_015652555.1 hypothetical protein ABB37_09399 [Leptomonas pyrrhocoris]KPA74114.1 hypothetical protein ABB37_09399 [Leptomonas pyrrhocoris]KPA74115.1 hypothetical protein ABB37_09399 [Leptomonas pyrrhocoris]KPA74116.1 hypothetical protein ABB37_09399 [Leptomonas pyrrhocoris]|eukprot:XP_015652553.1 hypothetical protein ABB37_09399 [Leptomonas pyrrhocoris]
MTTPSTVTAAIQMGVTLDGKISGDFSRLSNPGTFARAAYRIDNEYFKPKTQVCLVGRKTKETSVDLESPENYPVSDRKGDRSDFHADLETNPAPPSNHYYAWLDPHGRLGWKTNIRYNERFPFPFCDCCWCCRRCNDHEHTTIVVEVGERRAYGK